MRKFLLIIKLVAFILLCLPTRNFAQYLNLGNIEKASLYSVNGAVTNTGTSTFNGNIGAQIGTVTNFPASTSSDYTVHTSADAFTAQAKIDLLDVYVLLNNIPVTFTTHAAAFTDETVPSGVYLIPMAGSISGTITLDGAAAAGKGGVGSDAIFIFKFQGAFSPAVDSKIILTNGARASNIFWIAEGAIAAGTGCTMVGTFLAHPGAVTIGGGSTLNGRMLSTTGALNFGPGTASLPVGPNTIPISCATTCFNNILGSAANFTLFTSLGALANTGISGVIGDIGSNTADGVSGFAASIVIGNTHAADAVTEQAKIDLLAAYNYITNLVATSNSVIKHDRVYGGETLYAGIYTTANAGSTGGTLILDGKGDPNSTFIFQIGGAFTVAAQTRVVLINGARRCNIFWTAEGAISMATFTFMKGNLIAHEGAISMGGQGFLEGRMFSTNGACSFNTATTYISNALCGPDNDPYPPKVLPIQLISFTGNCYKQSMILKWTTASEFSNKNFSVERSDDGINWKLVGSVAGAGNSDVARNYSLVDNLPSVYNTSMYRLKQTDTENNFTYSNIITVTKCSANENVSFSPNPSTGKFNFNFSGDVSQVASTEIFNQQGVMIYRANGFQSKIDLSNQAAGIYLVRVQLNSKITIRKIIISK